MVENMTDKQAIEGMLPEKKVSFDDIGRGKMKP